MDLIDELKALSSKISKKRENIQTEEATKNAFVMPFIRALGYDVFDPTEVTPELTADVGTKKGEKVDYAILKDGKPIILFECKWCGTDIEKEHKSQLYRYFSVTEARFAVLTNGINYHFYTDIEEPNKMDSKPFLELNMLDLKESAAEDLKRFSQSFFDLEENLTAATELKYTREIKQLLAAQFAKPSEEFVKFFASQVYSGKLVSSVKQQFTELVKKALQQFMSDRINERLKSALAAEEPAQTNNTQTAMVAEPTLFKEKKKKAEKLKEPVPAKEAAIEEKKKDGESRIVTTEAEIEGHNIIKALLKEIIDPERIVMRDTVNYCGILFDDNNRKPICRLHFNSSKKKRLGLFDENRVEEKILIENLDEISQYAEKLKETVKRYLQD
ncbi:restriction endonuclease or methylase [Candidatus Thiomargarita nelsonii]|uniref:Restriction endonuclease or methylase n=1 Tax=Candidatus Thiomargarita nelsonii TaxID=1003181 RepID=A0A0A6RM77_9GAMM|nr:restriction endonuclease or methylase [Candidatus Thiomargarita nelsonii]